MQNPGLFSTIIAKIYLTRTNTLGYNLNPDFALEIAELYTNHCTVSTYGETIDAPTGAPQVFRKYLQHKRLIDFKQFQCEIWVKKTIIDEE